MNLLEHLADHLDFSGFALLNTDETPGNLFWGILPESPDCALAILSTDSAVPGGEARVQIFTRGAPGDIRTPYEWSCVVAEGLDGFSGFLHGDGPFAKLEILSTAQGCGLDTRGRHLYVSNLQVTACAGMNADDWKLSVPSP